MLRPAFAFPLRTDAGAVAVVAGVLSGTGRPSRSACRGRARRAAPGSSGRPPSTSTPRCSSRRFRDAATADERRRLAREMHDGVAQDIASLGYLVDAPRRRIPPHPSRPSSCGCCATRITSVVAEVRRSVLTLRIERRRQREPRRRDRLGLARHLSAVSGVPIHGHRRRAAPPGCAPRSRPSCCASPRRR